MLDTPSDGDIEAKTASPPTESGSWPANVADAGSLGIKRLAAMLDTPSDGDIDAKAQAIETKTSPPSCSIAKLIVF